MMDLDDHSGNASLALFSAESISPLVAFGTFDTTWLVAGLWISVHSLVSESTNSLLMNNLVVGVVPPRCLTDVNPLVKAAL